MREIVLDTETTGLDPFRGDRLVEVGCIELLNRIPSGQTFHRYINPQRDVPEEAYKVHGLSTQFLADKPLFADVCDELLAFIGDAPLVIHNASFDIAFLNAELDRCGKVALARERLLLCDLRCAGHRGVGPWVQRETSLHQVEQLAVQVVQGDRRALGAEGHQMRAAILRSLLGNGDRIRVEVDLVPL